MARKRKPGRPKGSVNKKTMAKYHRLVKKYGKVAVDRELTAAHKLIASRKGKRGRPKGSKNTTHKTHHRKPGRPKGSKNKKHHGHKKSKTFHAHGVKVTVSCPK